MTSSTTRAGPLITSGKWEEGWLFVVVIIGKREFVTSHNTSQSVHLHSCYSRIHNDKI